MNRKIIGFFILGILIVTVLPGLDAAIQKNNQKDSTIVLESSFNQKENIIALGSRLFGIGFVRINGFTHIIKGFVILGINNGQVLSMEFIRVKYSEVNVVLAGYFSSLIFFIRYNPA